MLDAQHECGKRAIGRAYEMHRSEFKHTNECREVVRFDVCRMILCRKRVIVRIVIAAAVRDDPIVPRECFYLRLPGAVIAQTPVEQNERFALSLLEVM